MNKKPNLAFVCLLALAGCASIEHKTTIHQKLNVERVAGVGDLVYSSTSEKSLPNIHGKADLFGRTTPTGKTSVTFKGIKNDKAYFNRDTVEIETGATTMNSTPIFINNTAVSTHTGTVGGAPYSGTTYSTGPSAVVLPTPPQPAYMARSNEITVDLITLPSHFIVEGVKVQIIGFSSNSISYIIKNN